MPGASPAATRERNRGSGQAVRSVSFERVAVLDSSNSAMQNAMVEVSAENSMADGSRAKSDVPAQQQENEGTTVQQDQRAAQPGKRAAGSSKPSKANSVE